MTDEIFNEPWPTVIYQGRKWDAPFTDDAVEGEITGFCDWCQEEIHSEDDAVQLPHMTMHLECHLRMALGDVNHLEGRCICSGGDPSQAHDETSLTLRQEAQASLQWLVDNYRGRFHA